MDGIINISINDANASTYKSVDDMERRLGQKIKKKEIRIQVTEMIIIWKTIKEVRWGRIRNRNVR